MPVGVTEELVKPSKFFWWILLFGGGLGVAGKSLDQNPAPESAAAAVDSTSQARQRQLIYQRLSALGLVTDPELRIFGENLLEPRPVSSPVIGMSSVPPEYKLGPGDKLEVYLLGKAQREFELPVLPEGKVYVPTAGLIAVAGLTLEQATATLRQHMANYFNTQDFAVALLSPKIVMVEVTGEVQRPGQYAVNGLSTVLEVLQLAGGPTPLGSLRNIRLQGSDGTEVHVDLYESLLAQQRPRRMMPQAGDRIFVPPARHWVAIAGEVHRPAIYELRDDASEKLADLLEMAGGATPLANLEAIEWSRLQPDGTRRLRIINQHELLSNDEFDSRLKHGDRIRVFSLLQASYPRKVAVYGEVNSPGVYEHEANLHVSDLIQRAGGLTRAAYLLEAEVARIDPGKPPTVEKLRLAELFPDSGTSAPAAGNGHVRPLADLLLDEDDQLFIRRIPDWRIGPVVEIRGEVEFPGFYPIDRGKTPLSEIIRRAGGITKDAWLQEARLYRRQRTGAYQPGNAQVELPIELLSQAEKEAVRLSQSLAANNRVSVNFHKLLIENDSDHDVVLEPGDLIDIPRQSGLIFVTGAVGLPGGVPFQSGHSLDDYIAKAGGLGLNASRGRVKVVRASGEVLDDEDVDRLYPGDTIWVPVRGDRTAWVVVRELVTVAAQLATVFLIIDRATSQ